MACCTLKRGKPRLNNSRHLVAKLDVALDKMFRKVVYYATDPGSTDWSGEGVISTQKKQDKDLGN